MPGQTDTTIETTFLRYTSKSPVTGFLNHPRLANDADEIKSRKKRVQKLKDQLTYSQKYYENAKKFDDLSILKEVNEGFGDPYSYHTLLVPLASRLERLTNRYKGIDW